MSRKVTRLRDNWKFTRTKQSDAASPDCDASQWQTVQVPHDWAIAGPFDSDNDRIEMKNRQADVEAEVRYITGRTGGLPHMGEDWYRIWVDVPATENAKCYRLECDGIMSRSVIHCNGQKVGGWGYGYSSFALDHQQL